MSTGLLAHNLAKHIRAYRTTHSETVAQFAKGCGVSASTIRKIENGSSDNITTETIDKVCCYLNIDMCDFFLEIATGKANLRKSGPPGKSTDITPAPQEAAPQKTVLISTILADIPSDEKLAELFPDPYQPGKSSVSRFGLEILKLRLEGLDSAQTAEKLHISCSRVEHWSLRTVRMLTWKRPDNIEIDIPALRKLLGIRPYNFVGDYTKLSELLRDMPSDEVLNQIDRERGNLTSGKKRHRVSNQDLYVLQQRLAGRTYRNIGEEFGKSPEAVRRWIWKIKVALKWYLGVELDVPELFEEKNEKQPASFPPDML